MQFPDKDKLEGVYNYRAVADAFPARVIPGVAAAGCPEGGEQDVLHNAEATRRKGAV